MPEQKKKLKSSGKMLLRKALSKSLPLDMTKAQKQGFSAPDASWFKGESIEYVKKELQHDMPFLNSKIIFFNLIL